MASQQRPTTLNFITGNANKLAEVRAILGDVAGLDLQSRDVPGLDEIQGSIEEIARDKCRRAAERVSDSFLLFGGDSWWVFRLVAGGWEGEGRGGTRDGRGYGCKVGWGCWQRGRRCNGYW